MINKIAVSLIFILSSSCVYSDSEDFMVVNSDEFLKYFSFSYLDGEGGELVLYFSTEFIKGYSGDSCVLSANLTLSNKKGSLTEWEQIMGMSFVDLSFEQAASQSYYAGGFGDNLKVRLTYHATQCNLERKQVYSAGDRIEFFIEDFRTLQ